MPLSLGIVGLPNVGKSTLFNALLKRQAALAANYPFATIEPNVGVVDVPDVRLEKLAEVIRHDFGPSAGSDSGNSTEDTSRKIPEKIIPAMVKFIDIAGLVKGAHKGEGLGNAFLGHIREVDAILHVVRVFDDENISRAGSTNPEEDRETINTELILSDLATLEKRMASFGRELKKDSSKENKEKSRLYQLVYSGLNENKLASNLELTPEEKIFLKDLNLLTLKPMLYIYNISEHLLSNKAVLNELKASEEGVPVCAKFEEDLSQLPAHDKEAFLDEYGLVESGINVVIRRGYELLGLQTFLTAGPKEIRAWTVEMGMKAPQAAGAIHSDFERGFISAEIVSYADLLEMGSYKIAKDKGLIRLEGKEYVMQEGDVVEFRFSV
jgi:ribosome-binding ATPase